MPSIRLTAVEGTEWVTPDPSNSSGNPEFRRQPGTIISLPSNRSAATHHLCPEWPAPLYSCGRAQPLAASWHPSRLPDLAANQVVGWARDSIASRSASFCPGPGCCFCFLFPLFTFCVFPSVCIYQPCCQNHCFHLQLFTNRFQHIQQSIYLNTFATTTSHLYPLSVPYRQTPSSLHLGTRRTDNKSRRRAY